MLRKFLTIMMAFVIGFLSIPITNQDVEERAYQSKKDCIVSYDENGDVLAKTEAEGSVISCKYVKNTGRYYLYRDDNEYQVSVEMVDGCALVDIYDIHESNSIKDGKVEGQAVVYLEYALWTVAAIVAAKAVISSVLEITETSNTYFSVDSIAKTIKTVKNGAFKKSQLKTIVGVTSYWTLRYTRRKTENNYFYAKLSNGKVYIGPMLTYGLAKRRLSSGYDIFATNSAAARFLSDMTSPVRTSRSDPPHIASEGYYPHFHPIGVPWYKNARHNPHVWYPAV